MELVSLLKRLTVCLFIFGTVTVILNAYILDHLYYSYPASHALEPKATYKGARMLTLNMFMRPPGIHSHSSDYKNQRLRYLIDEVLPHYDIITLQEMFAFMSTRRRRLIRAAEEQGFHYWITSPPKSLWDLSIDGGLLILSRYPIVEMDSVQYPRGEYSDWLASKGALFAKIALNPASHMYLFTTHTQASYGRVTPLEAPSVKIRFNQFSILHEFIASKTSQRLPGEPVVLQGDLNVDARLHSPGHEEDLYESRSSEEYLRMLEILRGTSFASPAPNPVIVSKGSVPLSPLTPSINLGSTVDRHQPIHRVAFRDLVYHQYRYHPVTFADLEVLDDGQRVPRDQVLTDNSLHGSCQRLDFVFWADGEDYPSYSAYAEPTSRFAIQPVNTTVMPFFVEQKDIPAPFTQLSDHYGVSTEVMVVKMNNT
ncbi:hypothetical protein IWQ62_002203 [Dispira parvispora]|uniref:sphingomyelin phosphodiesterase n=1 Tax=Dispira parvispora TaxID=1520584 RepID=A0A9W8ARU6_9FUNG|nr:hypothetical protein IWQ62_002203 [Dispira parvispora]